jgi:hypothetical protein
MLIAHLPIQDVSSYDKISNKTQNNDPLPNISIWFSKILTNLPEPIPNKKGVN